jgi:hypothetical protein
MDKPTEKSNNNLMKQESGEIRARCGFLCSSCKAYKGNIRSDSDRNRVHIIWKKIYGHDIPEEVICCDGCLKPDDENPTRIGRDCPIRSCVLEKKIPHCGLCNSYPCDLIEKHLDSVESVTPGCRVSCTQEEFRDFVEPYLCRNFLEKTI